MKFSNPAKIGIGVGMAAGAAAAIYYATRPATPTASGIVAPGSSTTPPAKPGTSAGGTTIYKPPPVSVPAAPAPSGGPQTYTVTEKDNHKNVNMHINDVLVVTLNLPTGVTGYVGAQTGTMLTPIGAGSTSVLQTTQSWTATAIGSEDLTYTGSDGSKISFNINVI
jgi:hypothetical protein